MSLDTLEAIRTRRVAKFYAEEPVADEILWKVLEMARWAPTAGNRRKHRYVCITNPKLIRQVKMFSPGMVAGQPAALIIICIDWNLTRHTTMDQSIKPYLHAYIDVGLAAENMLLAAHALGLVAGPMTSFSPGALQVLLNMPEGLDLQMIIGLGYPAEPLAYMPQWPKMKVQMKDLVQWGPFPVEA